MVSLSRRITCSSVGTVFGVAHRLIAASTAACAADVEEEGDAGAAGGAEGDAGAASGEEGAGAGAGAGADGGPA